MRKTEKVFLKEKQNILILCPSVWTKKFWTGPNYFGLDQKYGKTNIFGQNQNFSSTTYGMVAFIVGNAGSFQKICLEFFQIGK